MSAPIKPQADGQARIRQNVARMRSSGASDAEVETYLRDYEGLTPKAEPNISAAPARQVAAGTAAQPAPVVRNDVLPEAERGSGAGNTARALIGQGALLGFGDEAAALGRAAVDKLKGKDFTDSYDRNVHDERAKLRDFGARHPVLRGVNELVGGILPIALTGGEGAVVRGAAGVGRGLPMRMALGAAEGAATGAAYGTGSADPQTTGGPVADLFNSERLGGALRGATAGAAIGAAVPAAGQVASRTAQRFGLTRGAVADKAENTVLRALAKDEVDPATHAANTQRAARVLGQKPEMVADAGRNTQRLARAVQTTGGKDSERLARTLETRHTAQSTRLAADLESAMGVKHQNVLDLADDLAAKQSAAAAPLYEAAYAHGPVDDPEILALLTKPSMQAAYKRAQAIAAEEGVPLTDLAQIAAGARPDVRTLDYIKRGLDDMLAVGKRGGEGGLGPSQTRAIQQTKTALLTALDKAVPEYAQARSTFAGHAAVRDALEEGPKAWRQTPEQLQRTLAGMSPSEQQAYKTAALADRVQRLRTAPDAADLVKRLMGNPNDRKVLAMLIGDPQRAQMFETQMAREAVMARTHTMAQGSNTANKVGDLAAYEDMNPVSAFMGGGVKGLRQRMAQGLETKAKEKVNDQVAQMLRAGANGTPELVGQLQRFGTLSKRQLDDFARAMAMTRVFGAPAALAAGGSQ
jgi:hypothetical protein